MVIRQKNLIEFQIYYLMVIFGLIQVFQFPSFFQYILDANLIVLFLLAIPKLINILTDKNISLFNIYMLLFMAATVIVALLRQVPIGQDAWAARNNYFYLIFFIICCYTLKTKDIIRLLDNVCRLQAVNCIFVAFEYIILNKKNDYLGGMFGIEQGCNGALNIYLVVICAYSISRFSNKKIALRNLALIIFSSIIIAALSELKFFFIELTIIIALFVLINRLSFKNLVILMGGAVALYAAYRLTQSVESYQQLESLDNLLDYTAETYGNTRISRAAPISQINAWFFGETKKLQLFGYGFGACEESKTFSWANSSFADMYSTLQYRNLSSSMLYIELGWTGLIAFSAIFVWLFFLIQSKKKYFGENIQLAIFSQIICIMVMINLWYNNAIRLSIAYLTYLSLSAAIVCIRENYNKERLKLLQEKEERKKNSKTVSANRLKEA